MAKTETRLARANEHIATMSLMGDLVHHALTNPAVAGALFLMLNQVAYKLGLYQPRKVKINNHWVNPVITHRYKPPVTHQETIKIGFWVWNDDGTPPYWHLMAGPPESIPQFPPPGYPGNVRGQTFTNDGLTYQWWYDGAWEYHPINTDYPEEQKPVRKYGFEFETVDVYKVVTIVDWPGGDVPVVIVPGHWEGDEAVLTTKSHWGFSSEGLDLGYPEPVWVTDENEVIKALEEVNASRAREVAIGIVMISLLYGMGPKGGLSDIPTAASELIRAGGAGIGNIVKSIGGLATKTG